MLEGKPNQTKLANLDFYPVKKEKKILHQREFQAVLQTGKKRNCPRGELGIDVKKEMPNGRVNPMNTDFIMSYWVYDIERMKVQNNKSI